MKLLLPLLCSLGMLTAPALADENRSYDDRPKINVQGEAVVRVKPDKIIIRFGIETKDLKILAAKQANNEILQRALAAFQQCGVPPKDIQTDRLSIAPHWKFYPGMEFIGYFVRNTLAVTITDVAKLEEVVTKALESGVTHIHNVDFQTTEFKKHREEARELALKAAREKAEKMAAVLGESVGRPIQINENSMSQFYWSPWSPWGWDGGRDSGMSQNVVSDRGNTGEIVDNIALGQLSIRAQVMVVFELQR